MNVSSGFFWVRQHACGCAGWSSNFQLNSECKKQTWQISQASRVKTCQFTYEEEKIKIARSAPQNTKSIQKHPHQCYFQQQACWTFVDILERWILGSLGTIQAHALSRYSHHFVVARCPGYVLREIPKAE